MPTPFAYFKFDSSPSGGASLIDSVGGRDLASLGGTDAISDAGKIGNSWVFGSAVEYRRSDVDYFTGVVSATLRFWYMIPSSFAGEFGIILFFGGLFGSGFAIRHFAFPSRIFQCDFRNDNSDLFTIDLPILQDDQFHRVVLRYEHNVAFRCKFDNDSDLSIAANGDISPAAVGPSNNQVIVEADFDFQELRFDELFYSKEYLTDSQLLSDWNDGNGRTFPCAGLIDYWDFDDAGPPFASKVNPTDRTFQQVSGGAGTIIGGQTGILNDCGRFELVSPTPFNSVLYTVNMTPEVVPENGFTWTTWVNFASFGVASESVIFQVLFYDAADLLQLDIRAGMVGTGPGFIVVTKNSSSFFSPTAAYGVSGWYLIRVQFDPVTLRIGVQRAHPIFGIGSMEQSSPIADVLSFIVKGNLSLQCANGGTSPDYRQDESGFWTRLLTDSEFAQLWNSGSPPSYPNIPQ